MFKVDFTLSPELDCNTQIESVSELLKDHTSHVDVSKFEICDLEGDQYTAIQHRICRQEGDGRRNLDDEGAEDEPSEMFKYVIYGILIICVLGFVYFIINWIRCVMSRPKDLDDSSEDDEEVYDPSKRNSNMKKMEMKNVLP